MTVENKREMNKIQEKRFANAGGLLIKRAIIDKIGLLDRFIPYYGEEIDYCERVRKNGFKIFHDPRSTIIHIRAQTIDMRKMVKDWYIMKRQSIKVELLNYPVSEITYWWLVHFISVLFRKRQGRVSFNLDFPKRGILLLKAYWINLKDIKELLYKRKHRGGKIWVLE